MTLADTYPLHDHVIMIIHKLNLGSTEWPLVAKQSTSFASDQPPFNYIVHSRDVILLS